MNVENVGRREAERPPQLRGRDALERGRSREQTAIAQLRHGELEALHYLFVVHARDVYSAINAIVLDHHAAEDITQAVFAKLPRAIHRYEERAVPFAAWIKRVAANASLDYLRARRQIPVEDVRLADTGQSQLGHERARDLTAALAQLPVAQRQVVAMRHIAGLAPHEIADRMGRSEGSVHGLHHRGRTTLKRILGEMDAAPTTLA